MSRHTLLVLLLACAACGGDPAGQGAPATELVASRRPALPAAPDDAAWNAAPVMTVPLVLQDMVEPRLLVPSTPAVAVRALTDGTRVAFRLEWADATADDLPGTGRFTDGCAVQLPATPTADVPAPQMGETGKPVEVVYWRAAWQATVDGRPDTIAAIHPNAAVDHYPFQAPPLAPGSGEQLAMADRYAPARALGNPMAGPRTQPVQDLVGEGPGTLRPAARTTSEGRGARAGDGWRVVLVRPLPAGLAPGTRTQVAFAIWDGGKQEVGARKMRSLWVPLLVDAATGPAK